MFFISASVGVVNRIGRGAGVSGRPRLKSQYTSGIRGRQSFGLSSAGLLQQKAYYSSTSSPSADSSSPGTPSIMDSLDTSESPFGSLQSASGAVVQ